MTYVGPSIMMSPMRTTPTENGGESSRPFRVETFRSAFRPGVDSLELNQLSDELEARRFTERGRLRP